MANNLAQLTDAYEQPAIEDLPVENPYRRIPVYKSEDIKAEDKKETTKLNVNEEKEFKQWITALPWHDQFVKKYGETPNLDDPQYDYRKAYKAGISPKPYEYDKDIDHWPSTTEKGEPLKSKDHPTAWMNDFMQRTGVDPHTVGVTNPEEAMAYENKPSKTSVMVDQILNKLFRDDDKRYQLWPEKVARSALTAVPDAYSGKIPMHDIDPDTGEARPSQAMIERSMDMASFAGTGGLGGVTDATLGATPFLRPALKYKDKLYKGKEGQQHMDVIPEALYPEFQKMAMSGEDISHYNFGFYNDKGHFLDREKALKYGIDTGLIDPQAGKFGALTSTLMADSSKPGMAIEAMGKANPFFSAVEHNLNAIPQTKMTGAQWLGTLSNKPGVKPEELDWTGLKSFLEENKGKAVTKDQISEHLAANKVELKEVKKGAVDENAPEFNRKVEELLAKAKAENIPMMRSRAEDIVFSEMGGPTKYHSYQLPGGPLSRDTEILTNKGWKRIDAVEIGDVVMTRKDEAGILEWQPVQATPKMYAENLYHFFSQSINIRVTENHQMIAKKRRRNNEGLQRLTAKELWSKSEMLVPLTGVWNGGETDKIFGFDPNDLAELFGWYLAEGSYKHKNGNKHTIQISQCKEYNPEKCERIEALLDRMGLPWRYYGQAYGIGTKIMNKDLAELFHEQPTSEFKFVPYFFFNQSKSVIQSLLDGLILGDGCISEQGGRSDKITFFTKSEQLAGDVQILILMIGKNANVRQRPSGLYCVGIKSKEWSSVDEAKFEIAPYNDFAFCVTVENHAIYVRRNGVAAFTGNSNYREMLLTLPNGKAALRIKADEAGKLKSEAVRAYADVPPNDKEALNAAVVRIKETTANHHLILDKINKIPEGYKSSHWDEPNILAHVRMNDRTIDGKKSLHLEEIQSDWHQQGRDKGYKGNEKIDLTPLMDAQDATRKAYSQAIEDSWKKFSNGKASNYREARDLLPDQAAIIKNEVEKFQLHDKEFNKIQDAATKASQDYYAAETKSRSGVPDAPFKKSWHELALKRMIREAAERGMDRLSWTPGEAQAARYDLSKQINKIHFQKTEKGEYLIGPETHTEQEAPVNSGQPIPANKLADFVGKEVAEKIIKKAENPDAYKSISKLPEGYDLIKDGGKFGVTPPGQSHARPYHNMLFKTEKEAADYVIKDLNAVNLYKHNKSANVLENVDLKIGGEGMKGFYDQIIPKALEKLGKEHGVKVKQGSVNDKFIIKNKYGIEARGGKTEAEAKEALKAKPADENWKIEKENNPIHYIDIPKSLRDTAMNKGFPLFSGKYMLTPVDHEPEFK